MFPRNLRDTIMNSITRRLFKYDVHHLKCIGNKKNCILNNLLSVTQNRFLNLDFLN